jgi:peptidoglycan hydrolase-like protein with peptidoglycan-binding domain
MSNKEKFLKVFLALVFVVGISYVPSILGGQNTAQVISSFFSSSNVNETVLKAQTKLKEIGLYDGRLSGLFGFKTRSSIIDFQNSVGLNPNGILDIPTQTILFSYELPVRQAPIEIITFLPNSEEGNEYINYWTQENYNSVGEMIEISGYLKESSNEAVYNKRNPKPTSLVIVSDNENADIYYIESLTLFDFSEYFNKKTTVKGLLMPNRNNLGESHIVVNPDMITESDSNISEINEWTMSVYNEIGIPAVRTGVLRDVGNSSSYRRGGNPSSLVLYTDSGKYLIENIHSNDSLNNLIGEEISIDGVLMSNFNSFGIQTIIVNYEN